METVKLCCLLCRFAFCVVCLFVFALLLLALCAWSSCCSFTPALSIVHSFANSKSRMRRQAPCFDCTLVRLCFVCLACFVLFLVGCALFLLCLFRFLWPCAAHAIWDLHVFFCFQINEIAQAFIGLAHSQNCGLLRFVLPVFFALFFFCLCLSCRFRSREFYFIYLFSVQSLPIALNPWNAD